MKECKDWEEVYEVVTIEATCPYCGSFPSYEGSSFGVGKILTCDDCGKKFKLSKQ